MTKLITTVIVVIFGLVAIGTVGTSIAAVIKAAAVLVLIVGVVTAVLRIVWWRTGRW
jgi:hypothetical protein